MGSRIGAGWRWVVGGNGDRLALTAKLAGSRASAQARIPGGDTGIDSLPVGGELVLWEIVWLPP
jgi:hypothetical protein